MNFSRYLGGARAKFIYALLLLSDDMIYNRCSMVSTWFMNYKGPRPRAAPSGSEPL